VGGPESAPRNTGWGFHLRGHSFNTLVRCRMVSRIRGL
jgi:hypothetical protein